MSCSPDHRAKWTWEEGAKGEDGEWTERPALVLTRGVAKRRLRRPSSISSGSGSVTAGLAAGSVRATFSGSLPPLGIERSRQDEPRLVTVEDVKAVAVGYISTHLIESMKTSTAVTFDEFYRTEAMNAFLWSVLLYYNAFVTHEEASNDINITVPGVLGKEARRTLKTAQQDLAQTSINLGKHYSELNTGQSHKNTHHTLQGCLRASRSHRDQHLFEVIYEFAMLVTWIAFSYKDWSIIHKELGRLFKTQAFNRDVKLKGEATVEFIEELGCKMSRKSDEYLSYRVFYNRPAQGNLKELHSPALVSYFASAKEKGLWVFEPPYQPKRQKTLLPTSESPPERLGVIGELMSKVNPVTLRYIEEEDDETEEGEEEEEDEMEEGEEEGVETEGEDESAVSTTSKSVSNFTHDPDNQG